MAVRRATEIYHQKGDDISFNQRVPNPVCIIDRTVNSTKQTLLLCKDRLKSKSLSTQCIKKNARGIECNATQYVKSDDTVKDRNDFECTLL